jgi:hypothetical protein
MPSRAAKTKRVAPELPRDLWDAVRALAERESRSGVAQLALVVRAGMAALGWPVGPVRPTPSGKGGAR